MTGPYAFCTFLITSMICLRQFSLKWKKDLKWTMINRRHLNHLHKFLHRFTCRKSRNWNWSFKIKTGLLNKRNTKSRGLTVCKTNKSKVKSINSNSLPRSSITTSTTISRCQIKMILTLRTSFRNRIPMFKILQFLKTLSRLDWHRLNKILAISDSSLTRETRSLIWNNGLLLKSKLQRRITMLKKKIVINFF